MSDSLSADKKLEVSYQAAEQAKAGSKELLKVFIKYKEAMEATCTASTAFTKQLNEVYSSDWIQESSQIQVTNYLRNLGGTFVAVNRTNMELVREMEERVVEPLQNFTSYDFLEMVDARKKVTATDADYVAMRGKIESALAPKKRKKKETIDTNQLLQYESELERLRTEQEVNSANLRTLLDQIHQKKEAKLLKLMSELSEMQYVFHGKAHGFFGHAKSKVADIQGHLEEQFKEAACEKEGHLNLKGGTSWQKYWFILRDGTLHCYSSKGKKDASFEPLNILYTTTRIPPKAPKPHVFEIVTPDKRKPMQLQADSDEERDRWVKCIQDAIEDKLNQNEPAMSVTSNDTLVLKILSSVTGNDLCADCGAPNPEWASINLGILVCLDCSGVHRNLGTHITKVRSTILDTKAWEPQLILLMKAIGNTKFNGLYEAYLNQAEYPRPDFNAPKDTERPVREKFIKAKYAERKFLEPSPASPDELAEELYTTIATSEDGFCAFRLISQGANLQWQNPDDEMKTPTHCAVIFDKIDCLEMLIQNGADIFVKETRDWTPMHYASYYHRVGCAVVLNYHGFSGQKQLECKDWENKTAVELALLGQCEDIVDLLTGKKKIGIGFTVEDLEEAIQEEPEASELKQPLPEIPAAAAAAVASASTPPTSQAPTPPTTAAPSTLSPSRSISDILKAGPPKSAMQRPAHTSSEPPSSPAPSPPAAAAPLPSPIAQLPSPLASPVHQAASPAPLVSGAPPKPSPLPLPNVSKRYSTINRGRGRGRGTASPGVVGARHSTTSIKPFVPPKPGM